MRDLVVIGRNIQAARKRKKLTQFELSELVAVTPNYLSQVERGRREPSLSLLERLRDTLDLEWPEFFEGRADGVSGPKPVWGRSSPRENNDVRVKIESFLDRLGLVELRTLLEVARLAARASKGAERTASNRR